MPLADPLPTVSPVIPMRAQTVIAAAVALCLVAAAAWMIAAGWFSGGLVDHDDPPEPIVRFTLNINSAGIVELSQLPGLGPATAQAILTHRDAYGPFASFEAILDVPGIGDATLAKIRPYLRPIRKLQTLAPAADLPTDPQPVAATENAP